MTGTRHVTGAGTSTDTGNTTGGGTSTNTSNTTGGGTSTDTSNTTGGGTSTDTSNTTGGGTSTVTGNTTGGGTSTVTGNATSGGTSTDTGSTTGGGTSTGTSNTTGGGTSVDTGSTTGAGTSAGTSNTTGAGTSTGTGVATGSNTSIISNTSTGAGTSTGLDLTDGGATDAPVGPGNGNCTTWAAGIVAICPNQDQNRIAADCESALSNEPACATETSALYACMSTATDLDCAAVGAPESCTAQRDAYQECSRTKGSGAPDAGIVTGDTSDAARPGSIVATVYCSSCCPGGAPSCENTPSPDAGVCEQIHLDQTSVPPRVLLLQDVSPSMSTQWQPLHDGMVSIASQLGDRMLLGFVPFASVYFDNIAEIRAASDAEFGVFNSLHDGDCDISDSSVIAPSETSASQVIAAYDSVYAPRMVGGTPTYAAVEKARKILVSDAPKDGSPRYAILVTDGTPNCASPSGDSTLDIENSIRKLAISGVSTFVVGYNYTGEALDRWAKAGTTKNYVNVSDTDKLGEAMSDILVSLLPCQFALSAPIDPARLRVVVNAVTRDFNNPANGWTLGADGETITLTGQACRDIHASDQHVLDVFIDCPLSSLH